MKPQNAAVPACAKGNWPMIKLTRLGGEQFILNADLIRYVESRPDTFITLVSGERLVVAEEMQEVMDRAVRYQQSKYLIPVSNPHHPSSAR
jgi:flagellar protein FlbD